MFIILYYDTRSQMFIYSQHREMRTCTSYISLLMLRPILLQVCFFKRQINVLFTFFHELWIHSMYSFFFSQKRLYVDTYVDIEKSNVEYIEPFFSYILTHNPIGKKIELFLHLRMKRILRIPKRIYDGIKNCEQFQKGERLRIAKR